VGAPQWGEAEVTPTRIYANDSVSLEWRHELCIHCKHCINEMPQVFDLSKRPWVNINGDTPEAIAAQCERCPEGALVTVMHEDC
jgi:putative redox protein